MLNFGLGALFLLFEESFLFKSVTANEAIFKVVFQEDLLVLVSLYIAISLTFTLLFVINGSGGGALEWQEGVSGSSTDTQKHPNHVFFKYENRP